MRMTTEKRDEVVGLAIRETNELAVAYDQARAQKEIEGSIVLSKKFPRDEMKIFAAIQRSCKRPTFAEKARYAFPRGGATISGPSVNLARELARLWGNVRYGFEVVRDDDDTRKIRAVAWDMESNTSVVAETEFKKLVYRKSGGWITPDERDLRELTNKHAAILIRKCILQIVPPDFVEDAMNECARTLKGDVSANRNEVLKKLVRAFDDIGVSTEILERRYGYRVAEFTEDDITELRAIYQSIEDGNSKREEHFAPKTKTERADAESALEDLKPAAPEPAPTTAADLEVKLAGLDVGVPATSGEEVSARLTEIYRSTRITPENIEEAIRITGYNVGDDPANIRALLNSKKPNDSRNAIGVLLNWWKE
jgi:hypothetical protein